MLLVYRTTVSSTVLPCHFCSYMFLTSAMNLQIRGAIDVFFTGDATCVPGGPNFDRAFYLAWTAIIGSIFGVLGVSLFQMFLSKTYYRFAFWSTTVLQVAAAIIDIAIVQVRARGRRGWGMRAPGERAWQACWRAGTVACRPGTMSRGELLALSWLC